MRFKRSDKVASKIEFRPGDMAENEVVFALRMNRKTRVHAKHGRIDFRYPLRSIEDTVAVQDSDWHSSGDLRSVV
ncbi:hypothetical protein AU187_18850 [Mycobacterium sp. IS-1556]|nr:hypothetical protein AU187_18850 [Mycobacterium sp. IS-1556]